MKASLIFLTHRGDRATLRRETVVKTEILRIGRGADCELHLPDPRVLLVHATIHRRVESFWIETAGEATLQVNGTSVETAPLAAGDVVQLGPYQATVEAAEGGHIALAVELLHPLGDNLTRLQATAGARLQKAGLSKRQWAWGAVGLALLCGLLVPLAGHYLAPMMQTSGPAGVASSGLPQLASRFWVTGPHSNAHGSFIGECATCHRTPFSGSGSAGCLDCHDKTVQHADPARHPAADLAGKTCSSCHLEHKGSAGLMPSHSSSCTACHGDGPHAVTDFGARHPPFRATLPSGRGAEDLVRVALGGAEKPRERSNLNFPHDKHLRSGLRTPFNETVTLTCNACHRPNEGGAGFKPLGFAADCQGCHELKFDAALPERRLPHGKADTLPRFLEETYLTAALTGEYTAPDLPAEAVRRIPGQPPLLATPEKQALREWAADKAATMLASRAVRGQCGECHAPRTGAAGVTVAPVHLSQHFFPAARFDHGRHKTTTCATCHNAEKSVSAQDVLLPGIGQCRDCHGGPAATAKVASTCTTCHDFHRSAIPVAAGR